MQTPLAVLPEAVPFGGDELLSAVVPKMRLEWPNL